MVIKEISCQNYGPFEAQTIPLWSAAKADQKVTVIIGINGAGKTKILEATMTLLSWLVARIKSEKANGSSISDLQIQNKKSFAALKMTVCVRGNEYKAQLVKVKKGYRAKIESALKEITSLGNAYSKELTADRNASLPFIGFYPTERYVLDFPKKIRTKHSFTQIDGYDAALTKGIDFRLFFEWFREREDVRNEGKISLDEIMPFIDIPKAMLRAQEGGIRSTKDLLVYCNMDVLQEKNPSLRKKVDKEIEIQNDPQYFVEVKALAAFMENYSNLRIERKPLMRMLIDKDGQSFDILQLSQGERSLLTLVADIARRLAIMNPALPNPLEGEGIILIDEVDLHLHPSWQKNIVRKLRTTFPHCQFILTTHSPLVISDPDKVNVLRLSNGAIESLAYVYGKDVEHVLLEDMGTTTRNDQLQATIDTMLDAVLEGDIDTARGLLKTLSQELPADHKELVKAKILLHRQTAVQEA